MGVKSQCWKKKSPHKILHHHFHDPAAAAAPAAVSEQMGTRGTQPPGSECHSTLAGRVGQRESSGWTAAWRRQQKQQHSALSEERHSGEAPLAPLLGFTGSRQGSRYVSGRSLGRVCRAPLSRAQDNMATRLCNRCTCAGRLSSWPPAHCGRLISAATLPRSSAVLPKHAS